MRLLKFRAWDKITQKYVTFGNGFTKDEGPWITPHYAMTGTNRLELIEAMYHGESALLVWEQFTGLYDNFNIEIYEGDILSNSFMDNYERQASTIVWHNHTWCLKVNDSYRPMGDNLGWSSMSDKRYGETKIIGNIHEHNSK